MLIWGHVQSVLHTDDRVYEKHESVPHNPKLADVSFRFGDVESWGRGFIRIKAECSRINASLPIIDAENDGVSITATGCEKYMSLLTYGQYVKSLSKTELQGQLLDALMQLGEKRNYY